MGIHYNGLFSILEEKGISKTEFRKMLGISTATLAKLTKNEPVSLRIIEDICALLRCQPGDVFTVEKGAVENKLLNVLKEEKEMQLKGGIYHQTQVKLAFNSNHIEGSRLTEEQTRYIYETNTIGLNGDEPANIDDILETVNHFHCFDFMLDCAEDLLTEDIMKTFHKILKTNTSDSKRPWFKVGDYKIKPNMVGDMPTTSPDKVKDAIRQLLESYHRKETITLKDIVDFHFQFERIHPFQDGNGRVGRMILFKECLKHDIIPFIIEDKNKLFYYRGLREYESEKGYLIDTCLSEQDRYQELMNYFIGK